MQQEQYFKAVPVSEKPKEEGWHRLIDEKGYTRDDQYYFKKGEWYSSVIENNFCPPTYKVDMKDEGYTHYLQPIPIPDAQVLREALEKCLPYMEEMEKDNTHDPGVGLQYDHDLGNAVKAAREALSAGDGWVRCEDGNLPTGEGDYLCGYEYNLQGEKVFKQFVAKFGFYRLRQTGELNPDADGITGCFTDHGNRAKLVTHWKPLPSPPKK